MTDHLDTSRERKDQLKQKILDLHQGANPEVLRGEIAHLMGKVSYGEVVQVEQELIAEGLPVQEVTDLCDIHSKVLSGQIDLSGVKPAPTGHPVHTFTAENNALQTLIENIESSLSDLANLPKDAPAAEVVDTLVSQFRLLFDVDKHYRRKEYLLFPYMEKHGITGPPKVMWAKHDEARAIIKKALAYLDEAQNAKAGVVTVKADQVLRPALLAVSEMIVKETKILLPMCQEALEPAEWFEIDRQSPEIGFCLYDPKVQWIPEDATGIEPETAEKGRVTLPTGSLSLGELFSIFSALPIGLTYVDKDDTVRFFTHGRDPIFDRNRSILGRKVQMCHPPKSVHLVNRILDDFKSGRQDKAEFWINMGPKFVYITYWAVRDELGEYLGTVEMTTDLARQRKFEGEQRLLDYEAGGK
ncbi:DUF438 domain-containing protein [bacterium]|nr:DUF438 domain-containing protein [bacterium]MBU1983086.1 DUF438 domain-containing protein [bacterium]